jgi:hypothetical protein
MMELDLKIMGGDALGFLVMGTFWLLYFLYHKLFKKQDSSTGSGESPGKSSGPPITEQELEQLQPEAAAPQDPQGMSVADMLAAARDEAKTSSRPDADAAAPVNPSPPADESVTQTAIVVAAAAVEEPVTSATAHPESAEVEAPEEIIAEPEPAVSLLETCNLLNTAGRNSTDQDQIIAAVANQSFPLALGITKIAATYSWDKDSPYSDGKTLTGLLDGTEHQIEIQIPGDRNQQIDGLRTGDTWSGTGQITGRDNLFHRVKMNAD